VGIVVVRADANVFLVGVQAVGIVGQVLVWGQIPDNQTPNWTDINDNSSSGWTQVVDNAVENWDLIAA
jgi:hypothetical protein